MTKPKYTITNPIWLWQGKGAWHFVTINQEIGSEIKSMFGYLKAGWGSLPVELILGESVWRTSIFPDKSGGGYLIPIKKAILKAQKLEVGDIVTIQLEVMT
jgi:Domain of unknown function (DUF1905)